MQREERGKGSRKIKGAKEKKEKIERKKEENGAGE